MMKKFIWLKLGNDFFTAPKIKKMRKMAVGDTCVVIYLKMMLLSIRTEGLIEYQGIESKLSEELALVLDEDESNVNITLLYLEKMGLIEMLSESSYLLPSVLALIGSESDSAERMRKLRSKNKELPSLCDGHVTLGDEDVTLEKEKEEDREGEKEGEKRTSHIISDLVVPYQNIIDHLNSISQSNYRITEESCLLIKARFDEGFDFDDFMHVHLVKKAEWAQDPKFSKYLRPKTLYSNKFEGYRNQKITNNLKADLIQQSTGMTNVEKRNLLLDLNPDGSEKESL